MRLPEILCPKTISWDLSSLDALNAVWAKCARISLLENVSGRQPRWGTEVRLGWNDKELHGLFLCQDLIPWATETNPGDALWGEKSLKSSSIRLGTRCRISRLELTRSIP